MPPQKKSFRTAKPPVESAKSSSTEGIHRLDSRPASLGLKEKEIISKGFSFHTKELNEKFHKEFVLGASMAMDIATIDKRIKSFNEKTKDWVIEYMKLHGREKYLLREVLKKETEELGG